MRPLPRETATKLESKLTDLRIVQRHVDGVKNIDLGIVVGGALNSLGFLLHGDSFLRGRLFLVSSLLFALALSRSLSCSFRHGGGSWS